MVQSWIWSCISSKDLAAYPDAMAIYVGLVILEEFYQLFYKDLDWFKSMFLVLISRIIYWLAGYSLAKRGARFDDASADCERFKVQDPRPQNLFFEAGFMIWITRPSRALVLMELFGLFVNRLEPTLAHFIIL